MFENYDEETILNDMLSRVDDSLDKREGSVIYTALAPMAFEMSEFYAALDMILDESFADTASYYYLTKRCAERGIIPEQESKAVLKLEVEPVNSKITIGDIFALDEMTFTVASEIDRSKGYYRVECDTPGVIGNTALGNALPVETGDPLNDLESATITEVLIPGQDEEDEESLRIKYYESFQESAFGGNRKYYRDSVNSVEGVGSSKVFRKWDDGLDPEALRPPEDVSEWMKKRSKEIDGEKVYEWLENVYNAGKKNLLIAGGLIQIVVLTSDYKVPSDDLVKKVQNFVDPQENGSGDGIAAIGQAVNVMGASYKSINYELKLSYMHGYNFAMLKDSICDAIDEYHRELCIDWANSDYTIVRTAAILVKLLKVEGIADVLQVKINGEESSLNLDYYEIPARGEVNETA